MQQESIKIHFEDKIVTLKYTEFDTDVDLDDITKIHYDNIYGEIVTIPGLVNRIGLLKASVDNELSRSKLEFDVFEANLRKTVRSRYVVGGKKFTIQEVDDDIMTDPQWKNWKLKLSRLQKNVDMVSAIYWAVKSKDDKLNNIKGNITPKEFENEIVEGVINTIMIKKFDKVLGKPKA